MNVHDFEIRLLLLVESFSERFKISDREFSTPDYVINYIKHGENQLALVTLINQLGDCEIYLSKPEFTELYTLALFYKCENQKGLMYLRDYLVA
jgi:hypothetical protein